MRRTKPIAERLWTRVRVSDSGCWEWTGPINRRSGYGCMWLGGDRRRGQMHVHRIAWLLSHFIIPDDLQVLHHCDNKRCVNPCHLFLGTQRANMIDMTAKGRRFARLSLEDVQEIRRAHAAGRSHRELAAEYGVRHSTVGYAIRHETWRTDP